MKDNWTFAKAMFILALLIIAFWYFFVLKVDASWTTQQKFDYCLQKSWNKQFCREIFRECKAQAKDPNHCIAVAMSIWKAESWYKTSFYGYFGYQGKNKTTKFWVSKYKKWWYKAKEWGRFYGYSSKNPAETRYCMSEYSSNSHWYCPNGRKHFNSVFFDYKNKFWL